MSVVESAKTRDGHILRIEIDECPPDPFNDFDPFGHIVVWHRRYALGNKEDQKRFKCQEDFEEYIKENKNKIVIRDLYMYDHSGIALSIDSGRSYPFNCPWDSGQVGYMFITYDEIRETYGKKHVTKKLMDRVNKGLLEQIEEYNQYLRGGVYAFTISKVETCSKGFTHEEIEDSLSGIFGSIEDVKDQMAEFAAFGENVKDLDWQDGDVE